MAMGWAVWGYYNEFNKGLHIFEKFILSSFKAAPSL
jgi:hypothetical protein